MALKNEFEESSQIHSPFVDEIANPGPSRAKSRAILKDGTIRGKAITKKQRGFFGARAGSETHKREKVRKLMQAVKTQKTVRRFLDERGTKAKVQ